MKLSELSPAPGSTHSKKRVGRGIGSGLGKTSGRGHKGLKARSGGASRPGFEGGQLPLVRRLPKRGFTNIFAKEYAIINIGDLEIFEDGTVVDFTLCKEVGLVKKRLDGLKILGTGDVTKKFVVKAAKFTKSAKEKIEGAGGSVEVV